MYKKENVTIGGGSVGELTNKIYNTIYGIQTGKVEDEMQWTVEV
jgi:branched-chain amino acid aminotransferase